MSPTTDPRKDALSPEERELARIARALPAAAPSPELDRRILDAARTAVGEPSPRRAFAWRWGFGASAAAVLVVALLWPALRPEYAPLEETLDAAAGTEADFVAPPPPPPAPPAPSPSGPAAQAPASLLQRAEPATEAAAVAEDARRARTAPPARDTGPADLDRAALPKAAAALPPVEDDRTLEPDDWLERIRARLEAGDDAGARRSLAEFVLRHPERPLPDDLQQLVE